MKWHRLKKTFTVIFVLSWLVIPACLYCGHPGISHPYSWSLAQNACYFSLARAAFTGAIAIQLMVIFLGHAPMFSGGMQNPVICAFGKGIYSIALCYPVLIGFVYNTVQQPTYISLYVVIYLGMGDIMVEIIFGVVAFSLLEWPLTKAVNMLLCRTEPKQEDFKRPIKGRA